MKNKLYIIGAGSVGGHIALNLPEYSDNYTIEGFFDDDPGKIGTKQFGVNVLGAVEEVLKLDNVALVMGIAFPKIKHKLFEKLKIKSTYEFPSLIHNKAWISNNVSIGQGCIIYPGTAINFGSNVNDFAVINMNCSLGHHTNIGRFASLAPGVNTGGYTVIEEGVDMGIGSSTIQDVTVGANSMIGGQSMIIRDIMPSSTVAGIPARDI